MVRIVTNKKIKETNAPPRWASFRGFSLLFINPGCCTPIGNQLEQLRHTELSYSVPNFYKTLGNFINNQNVEELYEKYLLCTTSPQSFHVTVWDGLNNGNIHLVPETSKKAFNTFLELLPNSLLEEKEFISLIQTCQLVTSRDWDIKFKFDRITKWSDQVLALCLEPADNESQQQMVRLIDQRRHLSDLFREKYGITAFHPYVPHITLGYYANVYGARRSEKQIRYWEKDLRDLLYRLTITFKEISLFGFTDMQTFFRKKIQS